MNAEYARLVQESFARLAPRAPQAAALFYDNLFAIDPSLKPLFRGDLAEQGKKLMQMIAAAVNLLGELDQLVPILRGLGCRHAEYGVEADHYFTVGVALIWTLEDALGAEFTAPVRKAWATAYELMSQTMVESAAHLPEAA